MISFRFCYSSFVKSIPIIKIFSFERGVVCMAV